MISLWEKLEHVRKKPEHVRQRYALVSTVIISSMIFFFWFMTSSVGTSGNSNVSGALSPQEGFFKSFKEVYATAKADLVGAFSDQTFERATETPAMIEEMMREVGIPIDGEQITATSANYEQGQ